MRIISGQWKGQSLLSPSEGTRPSTDRTRQALFSILQNVVENTTVLDLFAGSGSLSLECLSRGAKNAVAVEIDRKSCTVINKNVRNLQASNYEVFQREAINFLNSPSVQKFNLIFADPPYEKQFPGSQLEAVLSHPAWKEKAEPGAYFIAESPQDLSQLVPDPWELVTNRKYGKCHITVLQYPS